jgi:hypothetical protein
MYMVYIDYVGCIVSTALPILKYVHVAFFLHRPCSTNVDIMSFSIDHVDYIAKRFSGSPGPALGHNTYLEHSQVPSAPLILCLCVVLW